jgi:P-aminobenzoate N-oxygenase AurF
MRQSSLAHVVDRLNQASVQKFYVAYRDVDWDAPEARIERHDPRFRLRESAPLAESAWYRGLAPERQAELGLAMMCQALKYGIGFEASLSRGLLDFAGAQDNGSALYRYALHEVIEESQHSLMFQEFINRTGLSPKPLRSLGAFVERRLAGSADSFPELFFFAVLAGEIFIDHDNRTRLRDGETLHPLVKRILQIHVTEEARHVRFAESYLREQVPKLAPLKRTLLRAILPRLFENAQYMMLMPTRRIQRAYAIPSDVVREGYGPGSAHRALVEELVAPVFALLDEPGRPRLTVWKA